MKNYDRRLVAIEQMFKEILEPPQKTLSNEMLERFAKKYKPEEEIRFGYGSDYYRVGGLKQRDMEKNLMKEILIKLIDEDEEFRMASVEAGKGKFNEPA